jgi:RNA polymerase sigma-70 factor (ECF subfamily)
MGIAYRITLKLVRRQKNFSTDQRIDDYPEQSSDPSEEAENQDWLAQGLRRLPLEQRLALELAYHMGHTVEEIAAITGSPIGTVKARMFHAREKLREYLPSLGGAE